MNYWLLILPFLSAFTGWFVIWLTFRLLINSDKVHQKFIREITRIISAELPDSNYLEQKISDPANLRAATPVIEKHIDDFLRVRLGKEMPFLSHFIGDKTINSLKKVFMEELESLFPEVMKGFVQNLKKDFDPRDLIHKKIAGFSPTRFRQLISTALSKDINKISLLAMGIGFLFGILELIILHFAL